MKDPVNGERIVFYTAFNERRTGTIIGFNGPDIFHIREDGDGVLSFAHRMQCRRLVKKRPKFLTVSYNPNSGAFPNADVMYGDFFKHVAPTAMHPIVYRVKILETKKCS